MGLLLTWPFITQSFTRLERTAIQTVPSNSFCLGSHFVDTVLSLSDTCVGEVSALYGYNELKSVVLSPHLAVRPCEEEGRQPCPLVTAALPPCHTIHRSQHRDEDAVDTSTYMLSNSRRSRIYSIRALEVLGCYLQGCTRQRPRRPWTLPAPPMDPCCPLHTKR